MQSLFYYPSMKTTGRKTKKLGNLEFKKGVPIGEPLKFKNKFSKEEAIKFNENLKEIRKKTNLRDIVISVLSICIVGYLFYFFFN